MKFTDLLSVFDLSNQSANLVNSNINMLDTMSKPSNELIQEKKEEKPEDLLRRAGIKIGLVTKTSFGTQIDLAKKYNHDDIMNILVNYNIKIKGQSIFVVD